MIDDILHHLDALTGLALHLEMHEDRYEDSKSHDQGCASHGYGRRVPLSENDRAENSKHYDLDDEDYSCRVESIGDLVGLEAHRVLAFPVHCFVGHGVGISGQAENRELFLRFFFLVSSAVYLGLTQDVFSKLPLAGRFHSVELVLNRNFPHEIHNTSAQLLLQE